MDGQLSLFRFGAALGIAAGGLLTVIGWLAWMTGVGAPLVLTVATLLRGYGPGPVAAAGVSRLVAEDGERASCPSPSTGAPASRRMGSHARRDLGLEHRKTQVFGPSSDPCTLPEAVLVIERARNVSQPDS